MTCPCCGYPLTRVFFDFNGDKVPGYECGSCGEQFDIEDEVYVEDDYFYDGFDY